MISKADYIKRTKYCDCACVDIKTKVISRMKKCALENATVMTRAFKKNYRDSKFQFAPKVWFGLNHTLGANRVS
jgi:hypothetical protein